MKVLGLNKSGNNILRNEKNIDINYLLHLFHQKENLITLLVLNEKGHLIYHYYRDQYNKNTIWRVYCENSAIQGFSTQDYKYYKKCNQCGESLDKNCHGVVTCTNCNPCLCCVDG